MSVLEIYADGSYNRGLYCGVVVMCPVNDTHVYSSHHKVSKGKDNSFLAEVLGVGLATRLAIEYVQRFDMGEVAIYTDLADLCTEIHEDDFGIEKVLCMSRCSDHILVNKLKKDLITLSSMTRVRIIYVPGHSSVVGNMIAHIVGYSSRAIGKLRFKFIRLSNGSLYNEDLCTVSNVLNELRAKKKSGITTDMLLLN